MVPSLTEKSSVTRTKGARIKKKNKNKKNVRGKAAHAFDKAQALTYANGFMLDANDAIDIDRGDWILDSSTSRHPVNDDSLLIDSATCVHEIAMEDGESLYELCVS